jgi:mono/diheme cytochrome c family protein
MRILLVAALALGLALGLTACGGGDDDGGGETTTAAATTDGTTAGGADLDAGRELFISTGCGSCHALQDAGTTAEIGPNLDTDIPLAAEAAGASIEDYIRTSITDPDAWVMPRYSNGVMPGDYGDQLSEEELDNLVAYLVQQAQ